MLTLHFILLASSKNICVCPGESGYHKDYGGDDCLYFEAFCIHISSEWEGILSKGVTPELPLGTH